MPYVKTGPFTNGSAPGISSAFLNALETCAFNAISDTHITNDGSGNLTFSTGNIKRAAGYTEVGKYWLAGNGPTGGYITQYLQTISRVATPVSVSIDTADAAPSGNMGTPVAGHLTANGFQIYGVLSATSSLGQCAGNFTIQF